MSKCFYSNSEKNAHIKMSLERRLVKYGEISYVYGVMNKRDMDEMLIISNFPSEIIDNYLSNKYQNIDPVIINALNRISSFGWDENLGINSQLTVRRLIDAIKNYDIIRGHAFVLHDHKNCLATLVLYIDKLLIPYIDKVIFKYRDEIQGLLIYIHEMLLESYQEERQVTKNILSTREAEILYWSSTGKTYAEVARILIITVSTVKFHMANIVKKMGVKNAKHAISLANEIGIVYHPLMR